MGVGSVVVSHALGPAELVEGLDVVGPVWPSVGGGGAGVTIAVLDVTCCVVEVFAAVQWAAPRMAPGTAR